MSPAGTTSRILEVAIIGAGISGLALAAFLRKLPQYHVTIYERRVSDSNEPSAALGLRTNGIDVLKQLGISREELSAVAGSGFRIYNTEEKLLSESSLEAGESFWQVYRQDLKDALMRRVVSIEGEGDPVEIVFGAQVIEIETEQAAFSLEDGTRVEADLLVGADGIRSKVRLSVIPDSCPSPVPSGLSMYRFTLPMKAVHDAIQVQDKMPAMFNYDNGVYVSIVIAGDATNRNVVMYPFRDHRELNVACAIPDSMLRDKEQLEYSWNARGNVEEMIEAISDYPDWLKRILRCTPKVELFQIRDQEPLPTYIAGRTVLVGDAAHAMVPYQAQGANQGLEDVEGLNHLLREVADRDRIPQVLILWDSIRRPRAVAVQSGSRNAQSKLATKGSSQAILELKPYTNMKDALAQQVL